MKTKIEKTKNEDIIKQTSNAVLPENLIDCVQVRLKEITLTALPEERKGEERIQFAIQPVVFGNNKLISELRVCVLNLMSDEPFLGLMLTFTLAGIFSGTELSTKEQMGNFGQYYTLSILWPYAREFAHDIFRRTGVRSFPLPVINPTATTQDMLNQGAIKVVYKEEPENKTSLTPKEKSD